MRASVKKVNQGLKTSTCVDNVNLRSIVFNSFAYTIKKIYIIYSSIAQSVERVTVNHDVTGSSPVRGAKCDGL